MGRHELRTEVWDFLLKKYSSMQTLKSILLFVVQFSLRSLSCPLLDDSDEEDESGMFWLYCSTRQLRNGDFVYVQYVALPLVEFFEVGHV